MLKKVILILVTVLMLQGFSLAHHSREYIELEGYSTAKQGQSVIYTHYDYFVPDYSTPKTDHYELTPGFSYGITNRFMIDMHTHFAKFGSDHIVAGENNFDPIGPPPFLEAIALTGQYRITEAKQLPVDIAGSLLYEYPLVRSKKLLDGQSVTEATLIISRDFGEHSNVCLNLNGGKDGDEWTKSYGLGIKTPIGSGPSGPAAGIEIFGDFEGGFRVMPGTYLALEDNVTLKLGLGLGNEKSEEQLRYHMSLMIRF